MDRRPASLRSARALLALLVPVWAAASPTSDEFEDCHRLAAASLRHCLDESPGRLQEGCWNQSQASARACYAGVHRSHARDPEREAREKAAREAAIRAAKPTPAPAPRD